MVKGFFTPGSVTGDVGSSATTTKYLTGDFNKDGIPDLIQISGSIGSPKYNANTSTNNGFGSFSLSLVPRVVGNYETTTQYLSADVNNDGFTDLIEIWKNGTTNKFQSATWVNNGLGSFNIGPENTNIGNFAVNTKYLNADVNKDGFADLIQISQNTATNKYTATTWNNNGLGSFNVGFVTSSIGNYEATTQYLTGDFNNDGFADLIEIWRNGATSKYTATAWLNDTQGSFYLGTETSSIGNYVTTTQYLSADVNNDGATDLIEIWQNGTTNKFQSTAWLNDTQGSFYLGTTTNDVGNYAANTKYLSSDVNQDGSPDLIQIFQNGTKFSAATWINSEDSTPNITLAVSPSSVAEDGLANLVYTFTRTGATTNALSVNYSIAGTAIGNDYTNAAPTTGTTITFAAGASTTTLIIDPTADTLVESDETVALTLLTGTGYSVGTTTAVTGTILNDDLTASTTTTLPTNFTTLTLTGTSNIDGTGNASDNVITGNSGNNILDGSDGNDTYLFALTTTDGLGSDTIKDASGIDTISFAGTPATVSNIRLNLSISFTQTVAPGTKITLDSGNAIENAIGGLGDDRLIGNTLNNYLEGDLGNDLLSGGFGDDILFGGLGNNTLTGGDGNDILISGLGTDNLFGGVGNDQFLYTGSAAFDSTVNGVATIADFLLGSDQLVLSKTLFASLTSDIGTGFSNSSEFDYVQDDELAGSSSAKIVYSLSSGSLFYNEDGAATAGFGTGGEFAILDPLAATDFQIIV